MNKEQTYQELLKQVESVLTTSDHEVSNMGNLCALIMEKFEHHWVGFYLVNKDKNELYLGPFQGPLACTKIPFGKGVCGSTWAKAETIIVDNVHEFPGHIACSSKTNSEIVLPYYKNDEIVGVLDLDSIDFSCFDDVDKLYLEKMLKHLSNCH